MENQYFIFKLKDEYLPDFIKVERNIKKNNYLNNIYYIEKKYFRKLKIQNIENTISENEKKVLEFLINENFTHLLTQEEYEKKNKSQGWSSSSGATGYAGVSGSSASYTGYTYWVSNTTTSYPYTYTTHLGNLGTL
jgi:hypothetical protein